MRGSDNAMTPFSAFATTRWLYGPERLVRYNGSAAYEIQGENATGFSSGDAMTKWRNWQTVFLREQHGHRWFVIAGETGQRSGIKSVCSFYSGGFPLPCSTVRKLVSPVLGHSGDPSGASWRGAGGWMRDLNNDVYFRVALLTTIGLSSKNAILIVEFAEAAVAEGYSLSRAALRAAQTRLRPIIMTSLAFIAGVMPLAIATGAGANSRIAIGTGIIGGTLTATLLAIFFVPLFLYW